jgi:hypothetical protein
MENQGVSYGGSRFHGSDCNPLSAALRQAEISDAAKKGRKGVQPPAAASPGLGREFPKIEKDVPRLSIQQVFVRPDGRSPNAAHQLNAAAHDFMSKLISTTAIAVAVLLTALLAVDMSRPGRSSNQRVVAMQIPQKRILALVVDFHARLLVAASERLDSTVMSDFRGTGSAPGATSLKEPWLSRAGWAQCDRLGALAVFRVGWDRFRFVTSVRRFDLSLRVRWRRQRHLPKPHFAPRA